MIIQFEKQGQYFLIIIENHKVFYWDVKQGNAWGGKLQYLPPDPTASKRIDMSRNRIPAIVKELLIVPKGELEEYEKAKDDDIKLKELVLRDAKRNQCRITKITE